MWDAGCGGGMGGWEGGGVDNNPRFRILDGYVGDTGKSSSVWTSCCSKKLSINSAILLKSVTALLCLKLIIGDCCSNNLPVQTKSVQES